jgi:hypothetical protein
MNINVRIYNSRVIFQCLTYKVGPWIHQLFCIDAVRSELYQHLLHPLSRYEYVVKNLLPKAYFYCVHIQCGNVTLSVFKKYYADIHLLTVKCFLWGTFDGHAGLRPIRLICWKSLSYTFVKQFPFKHTDYLAFREGPDSVMFNFQRGKNLIITSVWNVVIWSENVDRSVPNDLFQVHERTSTCSNLEPAPEQV